MARFLQAFFRRFALILPALFQPLPHSTLDRFLWVRAALFAQATFSSKGFYATKFFSKLRSLFHACRVPFDYSWEWHTQESVVYARTTHVGFRSAAQLYVGSTGQTVHRRELARRRKLIQLSRDRIAYYEPALKIWHHQGNSYQGICIVLQQAPQTECRMALESSLIRNYEPILNATWVGQLLSRLRLHEAKFALPTPSTGIRFIRKAQRHGRYRYCGSAPHSDKLTSSADIFESLYPLYRLGSNTKRKFEEAKLLRSRNTSLTALYLRARLLKVLDEPWQTRARKCLQSVLRYRRGDLPPRNTAFILLPAAHDLRTEVRSFIQNIVRVRVERCNFPPLHLPSDKLILKKGQPLTRLVFNYRSFMKNWSRTATVKCTCTDFQAKCRDTAIVSGHLMCAAADVIPFSCLASANLADTTYFPGDKWRTATLRTLQNWCKHWKFPPQVSAQLPRWVDRQWELHQQTLQSSGQATWDPKTVAAASRPLRTLVLGPADHFPNSLFVRCPVYYHQLLCKTFGDPAVFQPCRNGTARIIQHLRQDFESRHPELQVYHWAFQWNKGLLTARILPKGSKQFSKARPIIAYTRCWHTKASSSIMQILFPSGSTLNVNSVMHALQLAWRHLQNMDPDDEEQVMIQQDLIGFFNSVPHSRICS